MITSYFKWVFVFITILMCGSAYAEPISKPVNAEIIVGYDFIVLQQQGDDITFKYSDSENFITRSRNPAKFSFNIETSREDLNQCSVQFITWMQQASETLRAEFGRGGSMDDSFRPGLAGTLSADKTVFTGDGKFKVAYSTIAADFFSPSNGEPLNASEWEDILLELSPTERVQKLSSPLDRRRPAGVEKNILKNGCSTGPFPQFLMGKTLNG